ncbi:MAG: sorbitol-6-phosphate dehydrogenase [Bacillota bacterium]|jgi:sorbitol-6-phosphate 2-dehydrogenase|nr:sorbitol-6-phosphate dehydrogenase [Bacillota bacterium]HHT89935.1 sorbitol-6-phosphate dehydrogenase [Bacillota bacterium]
MYRRLEGQVAIVTGAAQGLGAALAERLAQEGCKLVVADLNLEKATEVAAKLPEAIAAHVDVTKEEMVEAMVDQALREYGRIDLFVANAGIVISGPIEDFEYNSWRKVIDVNLLGYFLCSRAAARVMIKQKSGVIIQINSKTGKLGSFRNSAYAAAKFGGIGLTQSLALELAEYGIRVNAICPGNLLDSPLWQDQLFEQYARNQGITVEEVRQKYMGKVPLGRGCHYEDVANVLVFLASSEASYMTGQAINVTGGQEMR